MVFHHGSSSINVYEATASGAVVGKHSILLAGLTTFH
jgi:hypothetical protein